MDNVQNGTEENFTELVKQSDVPVLVDFWAPWCGPCKLVGPILDEVAQEYAGRAKIVKVNVDEEQVLAATMGVRSIPTLALYHNGEVLETMVGARPKDDLTALIDKALTN